MERTDSFNVKRMTMSLINIFTDHVLNRKSLKDYVEIRKGLNERGEFNDRKLLEAEETLQCLKKIDPQTYEEMYAILNEIIERDKGHVVEYPINFVREVLRIGHNGMSARMVCEEYRRSLEHTFHGEQ